MRVPATSHATVPSELATLAGRAFLKVLPIEKIAGGGGDTNGDEWNRLNISPGVEFIKVSKRVTPWWD